MTYGKLALTAVTLLLSANSVLYMSKHGNPFSWSWDAPDGWRFLSILTTVVATIIIIVFIVLFICEHWNTPIRKKKGVAERFQPSSKSINFTHNLKNSLKMKQTLIAFYHAYVAEGSNVTDFATKNGITNTDCVMMVQMGKKYSEQK